MAGSLFIANKKPYQPLVVLILLILGLIFSGLAIFYTELKEIIYIKFSFFFVFNIMVTLQLIKLVWKSKIVDYKVIFGMMSGFISLGLLGYFIFMTIELFSNGSFSGLTIIEELTISQRLLL